MSMNFLGLDESQAGYDADGTPLVIREKDPELEGNLDHIFGGGLNLIPLLTHWGLSFQAIAVLSQHSELVEELSRERTKPCFPAGYTPATVEFFYDDILCMRYQQGQIDYPNLSPEQPPFMEVRFDDQMALFVVHSEVIVNRVVAMAELDQVLGRLKQV